MNKQHGSENAPRGMHHGMIRGVRRAARVVLAGAETIGRWIIGKPTTVK